MATDVQTLVDESACFACLGISLSDSIKLALLKRIADNCQGECPECPDPKILTFNDTTIDCIRFVELDDFTELHLPNVTAFTAFTITGELQVNNCPNCVLVEAPLLQTTDGQCDIEFCPLITSVDFPSLTSAAGLFGFAYNAILTSVNVPLLQTVTGMGIYGDGCPILPTISFPQLVTTSAMSLLDCVSLTSFTADNWLPTDGSVISFNNCALDEPSIGRIFARCVAAGVTTCVIDVSAGTNAGAASWTAPTTADFNTLDVAGNTMVWNP